VAEKAPRILHLFPAFAADAAVMRQVRVINALGRKADHAIVSDDPDHRGAARHLQGRARISWPKFPALKGSKLPGRLMKLSAAMAGYDLICTYGAGALDAAFAHTLFADVHKLPPLVHHEHSLEEAELGGRTRAWYRRLALGRTAALIVSDKEIERLALEAWDQPRGRVRLIPNGIDTRSFAAAAKRDALPGLVKRRDELWLGCMSAIAGGDPLALVQALVLLPVEWQLVIAGENAPRAPLEAEAAALGIEDRLHFAAGAEGRQDLFALLDLLAVPASDCDQTLVMEAMAASLPLVALRSSEAAMLLASDNGPWLAEPGDADDFAHKLETLATRPAERRRIGQANRAKAREEYDEQRAVERFWALYRSLAGHAGAGEPAALR